MVRRAAVARPRVPATHPLPFQAGPGTLTLPGVKIPRSADRLPRGLAWVLAAAFLCGAVTADAADKYPARPVRFVIPFPPGGGNDILGRAFADRLGERFGQQWVADNRGGASSII